MRLLISGFFVLVSVGLVSGSNVTVSVELSERGFSGVSLRILDMWMSSSVNTGCFGCCVVALNCCSSCK